MAPNQFLKAAHEAARKGARGQSVKMGDFEIDCSERTVLVRGRRVELSPAEFDLLVFLAAHPKNMVTPRTMLKTAWEGSGLRQSEFLRVLLSLQKKLDEQGSTHHYIRTEPCVFYRFDPVAS